MRRNQKTPQNVLDARKAKNDADAALADLEARVTNGDTEVTTTDLRAARDAVDLAAMQVTGAGVVADRGNQARRDKAARVIADEVRNTTLPDVAGAVANVVDAVKALNGAVTARNTTLRSWHGRVSEIASTGGVGASAGITTYPNGAVRVDGVTHAPRGVPYLLTKIFGVTAAGDRSGHSVVSPAPGAEHQVAVIRDELTTKDVPLSLPSEFPVEKPQRWASFSEVAPMTQFDYEAVNAVTLRHQRDEMLLPYQEADPSIEYPEWIDRVDLVRHIPDMVALMQMQENRERGRGFVRHAAPLAPRVDLVAEANRERPADDPTPAQITTEQVTSAPMDEPIRNGGAVIADSPV